MSRLIGPIITESFRGKTLSRTLLNLALQEVELTGSVLDLGSSTESASYQRFLRYHEPVKKTFTDFYRSGENIVKLDLEKSFGLPDGVYDHITCFNTLEHIYDYRNLVKESWRVLKSGGTFVGGTPFLVNYHPDPHDYFRYTHEAIEKIFTEAGFVKERITSLGFGPLGAAASFFEIILPGWLRWLVVIPSVLLDRVILSLKPLQRGRYPLGYVYIFRKP